MAKAREAEEKRVALAADQKAHAKQFDARIKRQGSSLGDAFAAAPAPSEAAAAVSPAKSHTGESPKKPALTRGDSSLAESSKELKAANLNLA